MNISALKQLLELCPHLTSVKSKGDDLVELQFSASLAPPAPGAKPANQTAVPSGKTDVDGFHFRLPTHARPQ